MALGFGAIGGAAIAALGRNLLPDVPVVIPPPPPEVDVWVPDEGLTSVWTADEPPEE